MTSGAACAAALTLVVFASANYPAPPEWRPFILPASAFTGAFLVCYLLDRVARWLTPGSIAGLLLTGIALNALAGASWALAAVLVLLLGSAAWGSARIMHAMNALALGEAVAGHVGIEVQRIRGRVILLVAVLSGFAVAWCGLIGFVGLIAPHLVRAVIGPDQRHVLPLSMPAGGLLLLLADTLARNVAIPAEIPVGIFTALAGGPFFLALLRGARHRLA